MFTVNDIYWAIHGEGFQLGHPSVFVRFSGCNMACDLTSSEKSPGGFVCDTEFRSGQQMSLSELVDSVIEIARGTKHLTFTGGEPALQLTKELVDTFRHRGFRCAIETNGSINIDHLGLDWVTVSPKVAEHGVKQLTANELRYVRSAIQSIPRPSCEAVNRYLSPVFNGDEIDRASLDRCIKLIRENPEWKLSVQLHKLLGFQ